jgi:hypothetical protein
VQHTISNGLSIGERSVFAIPIGHENVPQMVGRQMPASRERDLGNELSPIILPHRLPEVAQPNVTK